MSAAAKLRASTVATKLRASTAPAGLTAATTRRPATIATGLSEPISGRTETLPAP